MYRRHRDLKAKCDQLIDEANQAVPVNVQALEDAKRVRLFAVSIHTYSLCVYRNLRRSRRL